MILIPIPIMRDRIITKKSKPVIFFVSYGRKASLGTFFVQIIINRVNNKSSSFQ